MGRTPRETPAKEARVRRQLYTAPLSCSRALRQEVHVTPTTQRGTPQVMAWRERRSYHLTLLLKQSQLV